MVKTTRVSGERSEPPQLVQRSARWSRSRERLLEAAQLVFAERGYRMTTTRDVADRAGVAEVTLFRHFESKAKLFDDAVLRPARLAIEEYVVHRHSHTQGEQQLAVQVAEFYRGLLFRRDSAQPFRALAATVSLPSASEGLPSDIQTALGALLSSLEELFRARIPLHGYKVDPQVAPRLLVGMALSVSMHDWLFPAGQRPEQEVLLAELVKLTVWGLRGAPS